MGSPAGASFNCQRNSDSASSSCASHAVADVDAVDAEVGQLAQDLRLRLAVLAERHAVEVRRAVDDVDAQRRDARMCRCTLSSSSVSFCSIAG